MRSSIVHDGASVWFILECLHGPFPLSILCYRKEVRPPQNFSLVGVHRSRFDY